MEARRLKVAELYLRGLTTLTHIARQLGVDKAQISRDMKVIKQRWRERCGEALDVAKARELAGIDDLEAEAWAGYQRSQRDGETGHSSIVQGRATNKGTVMPDLTKVEKTTETRYGDPRFLQIVSWCKAERAKIYGLYAAKQVSGKVQVDVQGEIRHRQQREFWINVRETFRHIPEAREAIDKLLENAVEENERAHGHN